MKLYSWNVNGIRAAERKGFLDWLDQTQPDILCLQETKARVDQLGSSLIEDHGYHTYWHSADKAGYSGVATFCKEEPYFVQEGLGIDRFDSEGRVLITEHENFLLYNIYFPNGQKDDIRLNYKLDFYDELLPIVNDQVENGNNVIITGDWNTAHHPIDLARPKENEKTSGLKYVADALNFDIKNSKQVITSIDPNSDVDITLVIGKDFNSINSIKSYLNN